MELKMRSFEFSLHGACKVRSVVIQGPVMYDPMLRRGAVVGPGN